jgi:adenosylcobinamide-phosphate synthase
MRLGYGGEVAAALLVDALFGEPPEELHPTVWMGGAISVCEKRALTSKSPHTRRLAGAALAFALPTVVYLLVRILLGVNLHLPLDARPRQGRRDR